MEWQPSTLLVAGLQRVDDLENYRHHQIFIDANVYPIWIYFGIYV